MSRNLIFGFANSVWTGLFSVGVVPFYLHYLGMDAYGLIGFFAAMQAVFGLLDMGLAPTINREVARAKAGGDLAAVRDLLRSLEFAYFTLAVLIAVVTFALGPVFGTTWFKSAKLPPAAIAQAVSLMGLTIAARFPVGLYVGALMGAQRMATASLIEMAMTTLAGGGAIAVMASGSATIQAFFLWQAGVAIIQVVVLRHCAWGAVESGRSRKPRFHFGELRRIWRFSAGMGVTAVLAAFFLQADRIILSRMVSLDVLGRYALAALAARSLYVFAIPAFGAVFPRMTALHATGDEAGILALYKTGTRLLMAMVTPIAVTLAVFSNEIYRLWTGDAALASAIGPVVALLALGTVLHAAMHFPYALQLAYGKARLPMVINLVLIVVFAPLLVVLTLTYGIVGAAGAWAILNTLYLAFGTWMTHREILRGEGLRWVIGDVGFPTLTGLIVTGGGELLVEHVIAAPIARVGLGGVFAILGFSATVALSPSLRRMVIPAASGFLARTAGLRAHTSAKR